MDKSLSTFASHVGAKEDHVKALGIAFKPASVYGDVKTTSMSPRVDSHIDGVRHYERERERGSY